MFQIDICAATDEISLSLCSAFKTTMVFAIFAFVINIILCTYAFSHTSYSPLTVIFRLLLVIDGIHSAGYMLDSFSVLLNLPGNSRTDFKEYPGFTVEQTYALLSKDKHMVRIIDCAVYKPFLFFILLARQWSAMIAFVIGLERSLQIFYPLWFKTIKLKRTPIVLFTLSFNLLSCSIAYINSLFVSPLEETYYSCEVTWAFGENYGWCQSAVIIAEYLGGWILSGYAFCITQRPSALIHFGNQKEKISAERRRTRKALWLTTACLIFNGLPQGGLMLLRMRSNYNDADLKQYVASMFLAKSVANIFLHFIVNDTFRRLLRKVFENYFLFKT
uniref:G-protein coupled receptors family 1 profile domain-containing protein n=1 Tax=Panagrolaimus sp. PS1159 TaxID=55785 RepID=A0AC35GEQ5_9BILA